MNYMEQVANMLGVEIDEEFSVQNRGLLHFEENGLYDNRGNGDYCGTLYEILKGNCEIKRKPWKPQLGERYCCISNYKVFPLSVSCSMWRGDTEDLLCYKTGNCFKTIEEITPQMIEKYKQWLHSDEQIRGQAIMK